MLPSVRSPKGAPVSHYFRGDNSAGITAPDLSKTVEYADHIVKARGKRTQLTSVSLESGKIRDFGDQVYKLRREEAAGDGHGLVEHEVLVAHLIEQARGTDKGSKLKAIQALRYARKRLEGLVEWAFDTSGVERKNLIAWAGSKVQAYFERQ
jgi:hypothetical protein